MDKLEIDFSGAREAAEDRYEAPELMELGSLLDLTQTTSGNLLDDAALGSV